MAPHRPRRGEDAGRTHDASRSPAAELHGRRAAEAAGTLSAAGTALLRPTPTGLVALQRTAGNRATAEALSVQRQLTPAAFSGMFLFWWHAAPHLAGQWRGQAIDRRVLSPNPVMPGEALGLPPSYGYEVGYRHPVPLPAMAAILLQPGEAPPTHEERMGGGGIATASGSVHGTGGPGGTSGPGPDVAPGSRTVKRYNRGSDVRALQEMLQRESGQPLEADGDFGSRTQAAVVDFQLSNGLGADGIVGPRTWEALGVRA